MTAREIEEVMEVQERELAEALGLNEIRSRINSIEKRNTDLETALNSVLTYINQVHVYMQELDGQPTVTMKMETNIGPKGAVVNMTPPAVPSSIVYPESYQSLSTVPGSTAMDMDGKGNMANLVSKR